MKKAVVLLSGGIDSATALYMAKSRGFRPVALIFDYGQRHKKEIAFARRLAKSAKCRYKIIKLPLSFLSGSLIDKKIKVPVKRKPAEIKKKIPSTYVPARNIIFLSIAVSFAETSGSEAIFIGAHTEDFSGYPDCREDFFEAFKKAVSKGTKAGRRIKIFTPLINCGKKDIIKKALALGVPLGLTWSCYKGGKRPCGECDSCRFRSRAFRQLGLEDPYLSEKRTRR